MKKVNLLVDDVFNLATEYHKGGNYGNAKVLYKKILRVLPTHYQSLSHLGLLAKQEKQYSLSVQYFYRAIEANAS